MNSLYMSQQHTKDIYQTDEGSQIFLINESRLTSGVLQKRSGQ